MEKMEKLDLEAKQSKYRLMREGLSLVKPETIEDWLEHADNNTNDYRSARILKATIEMMRKLEAGIPMDEAQSQLKDEFSLSGYAEGWIADKISYFSKKGDEYRRYWNKKWGIDDSEEERVVNPAILILKKKK